MGLVSLSESMMPRGVSLKTSRMACEILTGSASSVPKVLTWTLVGWGVLFAPGCEPPDIHRPFSVCGLRAVSAVWRAGRHQGLDGGDGHRAVGYDDNGRRVRPIVVVRVNPAFWLLEGIKREISM